MPLMDTKKFLSRCVARHRSLPVLILTSDEEVQAELAELGAYAFLNKSENPKVLLSWLINLIKRHTRLSLEAAA